MHNRFSRECHLWFLTISWWFHQHKHSKPKNLRKCIKKSEPHLETESLWSSNNISIFNDDETKLMLFWATQLSQRHNLNNNELFEIMHNGKATERVNTKKILWINFDGNLSWPYHINNVIQSFYAAHRSLCQFKRSTSYKVPKLLAKTLIISKFRYCLVVYSHLPKYQIQHLQKMSKWGC